MVRVKVTSTGLLEMYADEMKDMRSRGNHITTINNVNNSPPIIHLLDVQYALPRGCGHF